MSFSVGAALKKVAVSLLTDKKVLKWAGGIMLGALIIIMIPFAVIISLGTGQIKIDTEGLKAAVKAEMKDMYAVKTNFVDAELESCDLSDATIAECLMMNSTMKNCNLDNTYLSDCDGEPEIISDDEAEGLSPIL